MVHVSRDHQKLQAYIWSGLIGLLVIITNLNPSLSYNTTFTTSNHQYPIYSVLNLTLNNETNGDLQAQIKIFNETTKRWEDNLVLLEHIKAKLTQLPQNISSLEKITLFDYNTSFLPGCVYLLVSPKELEEIDVVANTTIHYILTHTTEYWYVKNISVEVVDLAQFNFNVWWEYLDDYISRISITTFSNYSIVNNTLVIHYPQRYNLTASFCYYNGSMWVPNWEFFEYCNAVYTFLNTQPIFFQHNVSIINFFCNDTSNTEPYNNILNDQGITPYITNKTSQTEINHMLYTTGGHTFVIDYGNTLSKETKITLFLTMFATIKHLWFTTDISPISYIPIGANVFPFTYLVIGGSIIITILIVTIVTNKLLKTKKKR